jgi:hypothetical protein
MAENDFLARRLADAFLSGAWSARSLVERGARALGRRERWLLPLVRRLLAAHPERPAAGAEGLAAFLAGSRDFEANARRYLGGPELPPRRLFCPAPAMCPAPGAPSSWSVPALPTAAALADWLGLSPRELDWFADRHGRAAEAPEGPLRHYTYQWLPARRGKRRLLERPKARLKALQRRLLHDLLDLIPPHEAAHGYCRGRSVLSYAAPHAGQRIVLRFDLKDFFPSVRAARVHALFRCAGYPLEVARALTGLCTNVVPPDVLAGDEAGRSPLFRARHLPQGAPISPALANLCAFGLDRRLAGLARAAGAAYTRYADDLAFSGGRELERGARRFQVMVCRLALEEGFEVNPRKSRFMRQAVRQQLAGIVVNARPNCRRDEYDRLKAVLTNCVRRGPASQNREGVVDFARHLAGRVAWVAQLNARRGEKLRALFGRIDWGEAAKAEGPRP